MISLFPITKIIAALCVLYGALLAIIYAVTGASTLTENIISSFRYAVLFEMLVLGALLFGWGTLWKWFPLLNTLVFPDIRGLWDVEIHWVWDKKKGIKEGKVDIKQNFISVSIELFTDESESETLVVQPKRNPESGRLQLFYIYRNTPKNTASTQAKPHIGTAILKFDPVNIEPI